MTIKLDQDHVEAVRGTDEDTMVKCTKTSTVDVYIKAIRPKYTTKLNVGDSTVIAKRSHVRLHLFRDNAGAAPFFGEAELTELAPELKPQSKLKAKTKTKTTIKSKAKKPAGCMISLGSAGSI